MSPLEALKQWTLQNKPKGWLLYAKDDFSAIQLNRVKLDASNDVSEPYYRIDRYGDGMLTHTFTNEATYEEQDMLTEFRLLFKAKRQELLFNQENNHEKECGEP